MMENIEGGSSITCRIVAYDHIDGSAGHEVNPIVNSAHSMYFKVWEKKK